MTTSASINDKPEPDDAADALYDGYHAWKSWDDLFVYTQEHAGYFAGELRDVGLKNAKVLEIGFGSGACLTWMKDRGAHVFGTEISDISVKAAEAAGVGVLPIDLDASIADHAASFDTIIAFDVFEHLSMREIADALSAIQGLLREGGRLVLRFPNAQSPFGLQPQMGDPTHKSALSRQVFELIIAERPFKIVRYGPSFRYAGRSPGKIVARTIRNAARKAINAALNAIYSTDIPYDPVVVLVLERTRDRVPTHVPPSDGS